MRLSSKLSFICAGAIAVSLVAIADADAAPITYTTTMSGPAEDPPNASPGIGSATVIIDTVAHLMRVQASFSGLIGNSTNAHIHCCTANPFSGAVGVATTTPTFPGFPSGVTSGTYDQLFDLTQVSSFSAAFVNANGGTAAGAEQALANGLAQGRAYFNIHSTQFGGGEIRGFLAAAVPVPATIALFGAAVAGLAMTRRRMA